MTLNPNLGFDRRLCSAEIVFVSNGEQMLARLGKEFRKFSGEVSIARESVHRGHAGAFGDERFGLSEHLFEREIGGIENDRILSGAQG